MELVNDWSDPCMIPKEKKRSVQTLVNNILFKRKTLKLHSGVDINTTLNEFDANLNETLIQCLSRRFARRYDRKSSAIVGWKR